ncbi:MAG: hypothetical protein EPO64_12640 [Nitrospirae bacterium]|nr:MAG: hypothetical protein EPO64_12640 [Nitrospirota bacterium]
MRNRRPIGLALLVLLMASTFWFVRLIIVWLPLPARTTRRWQWGLRKYFWSQFGILKFRGSRPVTIPAPGKKLRRIDRVPFNRIFRDIPISTITVADHVPADERDAAMNFFTWLQVTLYRLFPPMQSGLPSIAAAPYEALGAAYTKRHRKLFGPPVMPLEFQGSPDLGALAVKGPYAGYLKKCSQGEYEWDFRDLRRFEHYPELYNLGVRVSFRVETTTRTVQPVTIESALGISTPGDSTWEFAKKLALCAATNHLSLVRHFNGVHLASGAHLAIATRNCLFPDHPLCRLLWPYIFRTQQSNRAVTKAQMVNGGDFDSIFSFTHRGVCDLFMATYDQYRLIVNDPVKDARSRGILGAGFDTPTQNDWQQVFELFRGHVRGYIEIYYPSDPDLAKDTPVSAWINELNDTIPNGVGDVLDGPVTRDTVANLIASVMFLATVQHDIVGSFLWNYQSWAHKQPPRLYRNGQRLPLDVYQRLVNANFNLNVPRTPLMTDFSSLVLNDAHRAQTAQTLKQFQATLVNLEAQWREEAWSIWRVYPSLLEANINA